MLARLLSLNPFKEVHSASHCFNMLHHASPLFKPPRTSFISCKYMIIYVNIFVLKSDYGLLWYCNIVFIGKTLIERCHMLDDEAAEPTRYSRLHCSI